MFSPPRQLENLTGLFESLCDAAMDLDPQSLSGKIPHDVVECAHLLALADTAAVRECADVAALLSTAAPSNAVNLVIEHHAKITKYLFIRSMILDGNPPDSSDEFDLSIF